MVAMVASRYFLIALIFSAIIYLTGAWPRRKKRSVSLAPGAPKRLMSTIKQLERESVMKRFANHLQPRIEGGHPALYMEIPSQVYILVEGYFHCGGTLVYLHEIYFVITAAHCFWEGNPKKDSPVSARRVAIVGNDVNILYQNGHEIVRRANRIVLHPTFDPRTDQDDIALIFLKRPIWESGGFNPMALPDPAWSDPQLVQVSGWGSLTWNGNPSHDLQKVVMPILYWPSCEALAEGYFIRQKFQYCIGATGAGWVGPCQGDSGGPALAVNHTTKLWYLAGVISYGSTPLVCGDPWGVTMLTKVKAYLEFIKSNAKAYRDKYGSNLELIEKETRENLTTGG